LKHIASKRRWSLGNAWWFGPFWSGRADQIDTSFQYELAPHFQTGITIKQTFGRLPEGNFVARLFTLKGDYSLSPLLTFFNLVQFDTKEANLAWQSRVLFPYPSASGFCRLQPTRTPCSSCSKDVHAVLEQR
jgi:hypothetical protein